MTRHETEKVRVLHLQRSRKSLFHSIERLFQTIRSELPEDIECDLEYCQPLKKGALGFLLHALRLRSLRTNVYHITGDSHYYALLLPSKKTLLTIHDCRYLDTLNGVHRKIYELLWYRLPIFFVGRITTVSSETSRLLKARYPASKGKIFVVPNCPPADLKYQPRKHTPRIFSILHFGTLPHKNLERAIVAIRGLPCRLSIIGQTTVGQQVLLKEHHIDYSVYFSVSDNKIADLISDSDIISFPSLSEGFGMPIIEAQTVGRPVVTSRFPPMSEIAGEGACLVDPLDTNSIRDAFVRLMENADYRETVILNGLENSKNFTPQVVASQYAAIYHDIVKTTRQS